ncbi:hypothetical protein [Clostridium botulinum]|uniref:Uncharacterized protein n=2 Tax=Clostridium botulinum TaxID=1491 RepID=B1IL35_CLOBK|nr:hypothetical protein CLD_1689 [Clostridium botulinum B1 str. Okra]
MLKASLVDSKLKTSLVGLFAPRELADKEYNNEIKEFLKSIENK